MFSENLFAVICLVTCLFVTEASYKPAAELKRLFKIERNKKFIPDNMIGLPDYGHLKSIEAQSATECNIECLKTPKCGQTNAEKLDAKIWNCDLFGWGTGQTESSLDHHHYTMIVNFCEDGFIHEYDSSTYCFNLESLVWEEAEVKCLEHGATLVAIETDDEQTALANYMSNNTDLKNQGFHIGLNDRNTLEEYVWTGSLALATYFNWGGVEPNDINGPGSERCAFMNYLGNYTWWDITCSDHKPAGYICER
ncbi:unnamed protein product [Owenia fusiformis]|uniref:Uncharacterized protein n=1 Tax=Owenia fusiformis TaxID=6347 RepID=A0A8J1XJD7_OWEFU|nr:unnamed protein product [Owenia fusiformis]